MNFALTPSTMIYSIIGHRSRNKIDEKGRNELEALTKLADIYITARYYTREFYEAEVRNLFTFADKIKELLGD